VDTEHADPELYRYWVWTQNMLILNYTDIECGHRTCRTWIIQILSVDTEHADPELYRY